MLYNYSISNLTGLQDLKIKNVDKQARNLMLEWIYAAQASGLNEYGYRNFRRFRNRILHIFNYKNT